VGNYQICGIESSDFVSRVWVGWKMGNGVGDPVFRIEGVVVGVFTSRLMEKIKQVEEESKVERTLHRFPM